MAFLKTVASLLILAFVFQEISWAAPDLKPLDLNFNLIKKDDLKEAKKNLSFIPESIATVEDAWRAPVGATHRVAPTMVYLIQDAHTNTSGQINLSKTLDLLLKHKLLAAGDAGGESSIFFKENHLKKIESRRRQDPPLVFSEAGSGDNSIAYLKNYGNPEIRKMVAESFLRKGLLHGAEYLELTSDLNFTLWGVEEPALYVEALENYRYVASHREKFQAYLKKINQTIDTLKPRIYNPLLLDFTQKQDKYLKEELPLTDYFEVLAKYAGSMGHSEANAEESKPEILRRFAPQDDVLSNYPHLKALKDLKAQEEAIDFKEANQEQQKAIESLDEASRQELVVSSPATEPAGRQENLKKIGSGDHKEQQGFYTLLESVIASPPKAGVAISSGPKEIASSPEPALSVVEGTPRNDVLYPNLFKYFSYLKQSKNLNPKEILKELKTLEEEVTSSLTTTKDEESLLKCQTTLRLLNKLFNLTLTPEEYEEYKELTHGDKGQVTSDSVIPIEAKPSRGINPLDPSTRSSLRSSLAQDDEGVFTIRHLTGFLNKKILDLKTYYERALFLEEGYERIVQASEEFYNLTLQRDSAFIENMLVKLDSENGRVTPKGSPLPRGVKDYTSTEESPASPAGRRRRQDPPIRAVLITGGFHTPNLKNLLKQKNISYIVLTPQVTQETDQTRYENILLSQSFSADKNPQHIRPAASTLMTTLLNPGTRMPFVREKGMSAKEALTVQLAASNAGARLATSSPLESQEHPEEHPEQAAFSISGSNAFFFVTGVLATIGFLTISYLFYPVLSDWIDRMKSPRRIEKRTQDSLNSDQAWDKAIEFIDGLKQFPATIILTNPGGRPVVEFKLTDPAHAGDVKKSVLERLRDIEDHGYRFFFLPPQGSVLRIHAVSAGIRVKKDPELIAFAIPAALGVAQQQPKWFQKLRQGDPSGARLAFSRSPWFNAAALGVAALGIFLVGFFPNSSDTLTIFLLKTAFNYTFFSMLNDLLTKRSLSMRPSFKSFYRAALAGLGEATATTLFFYAIDTGTRPLNSLGLAGSLSGWILRVFSHSFLLVYVNNWIVKEFFHTDGKKEQKKIIFHRMNQAFILSRPASLIANSVIQALPFEYRGPVQSFKTQWFRQYYTWANHVQRESIIDRPEWVSRIREFMPLRSEPLALMVYSVAAPPANAWKLWERSRAAYFKKKHASGARLTRNEPISLDDLEYADLETTKVYIVAKKIRDDFRLMYMRFRVIAYEAKNRFEARDWRGSVEAEKKRLSLFSASLNHLQNSVEKDLGERIFDESLWMKIREQYLFLMKDYYGFDMALTFFYSIMRRVFHKKGLSVEYQDDGMLPTRDSEFHKRLVQKYFIRSSIEDTFREILLGVGFDVGFENLDRDARLGIFALNTDLSALKKLNSVQYIEMLEPVFFRNKGAYAVGRIAVSEADGSLVYIPLVLPFLNEDKGIRLDAVLTNQADVSNVFSSSRFNFQVNTDYYRETADFLKSIMPHRSLSAIYASIGFIHPAKIELIKNLRIQLNKASPQKFEKTKGIEGTVMVTFGLPSFPYIFKVVRDSSIKQTFKGRTGVIRQYQKVHEMDRVGRLLDSMVFHNVRFKTHQFDPDLLRDLVKFAPSSVVINGEDVVLTHVYAQRQVTPLDVYLHDPAVTVQEKEKAILDLGFALKDLIIANIFHGDFLIKNFGVTHYGRVVTYDNDDLDELGKYHFLSIPEPRNAMEEMLDLAEWMSIGDYDFFPEQLETFLIPSPYRELFRQTHVEIYSASYWADMLRHIKSGIISNFYPYSQSKRLNTMFPEEYISGARLADEQELRRTIESYGHRYAVARNDLKQLQIALRSAHHDQVVLAKRFHDKQAAQFKLIEEFIDFIYTKAHKELDRRFSMDAFANDPGGLFDTLYPFTNASPVSFTELSANLKDKDFQNQSLSDQLAKALIWLHQLDVNDPQLLQLRTEFAPGSYGRKSVDAERGFELAVFTFGKTFVHDHVNRIVGAARVVSGNITETVYERPKDNGSAHTFLKSTKVNSLGAGSVRIVRDTDIHKVEGDGALVIQIYLASTGVPHIHRFDPSGEGEGQFAVSEIPMQTFPKLEGARLAKDKKSEVVETINRLSITWLAEQITGHFIELPKVSNISPDYPYAPNDIAEAESRRVTFKIMSELQNRDLINIDGYSHESSMYVLSESSPIYEMSRSIFMWMKQSYVKRFRIPYQIVHSSHATDEIKLKWGNRFVDLLVHIEYSEDKERLFNNFLNSLNHLLDDLDRDARDVMRGRDDQVFNDAIRTMFPPGGVKTFDRKLFDDLPKKVSPDDLAKRELDSETGGSVGRTLHLVGSVNEVLTDRFSEKPVMLVSNVPYKEPNLILGRDNYQERFGRAYAAHAEWDDPLVVNMDYWIGDHRRPGRPNTREDYGVQIEASLKEGKSIVVFGFIPDKENAELLRWLEGKLSELNSQSKVLVLSEYISAEKLDRYLSERVGVLSLSSATRTSEYETRWKNALESMELDRVGNENGYWDVYRFSEDESFPLIKVPLEEYDGSAIDPEELLRSMRVNQRILGGISAPFTIVENVRLMVRDRYSDSPVEKFYRFVVLQDKKPSGGIQADFMEMNNLIGKLVDIGIIVYGDLNRENIASIYSQALLVTLSPMDRIPSSELNESLIEFMREGMDSVYQKVWTVERIQETWGRAAFIVQPVKELSFRAPRTKHRYSADDYPFIGQLLSDAGVAGWAPGDRIYESSHLLRSAENAVFESLSDLSLDELIVWVNHLAEKRGRPFDKGKLRAQRSITSASLKNLAAALNVDIAIDGFYFRAGQDADQTERDLRKGVLEVVGTYFHDQLAQHTGTLVPALSADRRPAGARLAGDIHSIEAASEADVKTMEESENVSEDIRSGAPWRDWLKAHGGDLKDRGVLFMFLFSLFEPLSKVQEESALTERKPERDKSYDFIRISNRLAGQGIPADHVPGAEGLGIVLSKLRSMDDIPNPDALLIYAIGRTNDTARMVYSARKLMRLGDADLLVKHAFSLARHLLTFKPHTSELGLGKGFAYPDTKVLMEIVLWLWDYLQAHADSDEFKISHVRMGSSKQMIKEDFLYWTLAYLLNPTFYPTKDNQLSIFENTFDSSRHQHLTREAMMERLKENRLPPEVILRFMEAFIPRSEDDYELSRLWDTGYRFKYVTARFGETPILERYYKSRGDSYQDARFHALEQFVADYLDFGEDKESLKEHLLSLRPKSVMTQSFVNEALKTGALRKLLYETDADYTEQVYRDNQVKETVLDDLEKELFPVLEGINEKLSLLRKHLSKKRFSLRLSEFKKLAFRASGAFVVQSLESIRDSYRAADKNRGHHALAVGIYFSINGLLMELERLRSSMRGISKLRQLKEKKAGLLETIDDLKNEIAGLKNEIRSKSLICLEERASSEADSVEFDKREDAIGYILRKIPRLNKRKKGSFRLAVYSKGRRLDIPGGLDEPASRRLTDVYISRLLRRRLVTGEEKYLVRHAQIVDADGLPVYEFIVEAYTPWIRDEERLAAAEEGEGSAGARMAVRMVVLGLFLLISATLLIYIKPEFFEQYFPQISGSFILQDGYDLTTLQLQARSLRPGKYSEAELANALKIKPAALRDHSEEIMRQINLLNEVAVSKLADGYDVKKVQKPPQQGPLKPKKRETVSENRPTGTGSASQPNAFHRGSSVKWVDSRPEIAGMTGLVSGATAARLAEFTDKHGRKVTVTRQNSYTVVAVEGIGRKNLPFGSFSTNLTKLAKDAGWPITSRKKGKFPDNDTFVISRADSHAVREVRFTDSLKDVETVADALKDLIGASAARLAEQLYVAPYDDQEAAMDVFEQLLIETKLPIKKEDIDRVELALRAFYALQQGLGFDNVPTIAKHYEVALQILSGLKQIKNITLANFAPALAFLKIYIAAFEFALPAAVEAGLVQLNPGLRQQLTAAENAVMDEGVLRSIPRRPLLPLSFGGGNLLVVAVGYADSRNGHDMTLADSGSLEEVWAHLAKGDAVLFVTPSEYLHGALRGPIRFIQSRDEKDKVFASAAHTDDARFSALSAVSETVFGQSEFSKIAADIAREIFERNTEYLPASIGLLDEPVGTGIEPGDGGHYYQFTESPLNVNSQAGLAKEILFLLDGNFHKNEYAGYRIESVSNTEHLNATQEKVFGLRIIFQYPAGPDRAKNPAADPRSDVHSIESGQVDDLLRKGILTLDKLSAVESALKAAVNGGDYNSIQGQWLVQPFENGETLWVVRYNRHDLAVINLGDLGIRRTNIFYPLLYESEANLFFKGGLLFIEQFPSLWVYSLIETTEIGSALGQKTRVEALYGKGAVKGRHDFSNLKSFEFFTEAGLTRLKLTDNGDRVKEQDVTGYLSDPIIGEIRRAIKSAVANEEDLNKSVKEQRISAKLNGELVDTWKLNKHDENSIVAAILKQLARYRDENKYFGRFTILVEDNIVLITTSRQSAARLAENGDKKLLWGLSGLAIAETVLSLAIIRPTDLLGLVLWSGLTGLLFYSTILLIAAATIFHFVRSANFQEPREPFSVAWIGNTLLIYSKPDELAVLENALQAENIAFIRFHPKIIGVIEANNQNILVQLLDLMESLPEGARLAGLGRRTFLSAVIPALAALFLTAPGSQKQFTPQEKKKANLMARVLYDIAEWQKKSDKRGLPKETAAFLEKLHIETKLSNDADLVEIKVSYGRSFSFLSGYFNGKDVSGSKDDLKFKYPSAGYDYGIYTKSWPVSSKNNLTLVIVTPDGAFTLKGSYKQGDKSGTLVSFAVGKIGGRLAGNQQIRQVANQSRRDDESGWVTKPSWVSMLSLPDIFFGETVPSILFNAGTTFLSVGGWIGINIMPAVLDAGYRPESKKSLSWVNRTLLSSTIRLYSSPFFSPLGDATASYPDLFRAFTTSRLTFSSANNRHETLDSGKRMIFLIFQDLSGIVKSGVDVGFGQAGVTFQNFLPRLPGFKEFQYYINRYTGPGEARFAIAEILMREYEILFHLLAPAFQYTSKSELNQERHIRRSGARLAGTPLTPKKIIYDPNIRLGPGPAIYGQVGEQKWNRANNHHILAAVQHDLAAFPSNAIVMDISAFSGASSLAILRWFREKPKHIAKLITTEVEYPGAEDFIRYVSGVVRDFVPEIVTDAEHYLLPYDASTKSYLPVSSIKETFHRIDLATFINAVHLVKLHQLVPTFSGIWKVLKPGGVLVIGSASIESKSRPQGTIMLEETWDRVHTALLKIVDSDPAYSDLKARLDGLSGQERETLEKPRAGFFLKPYDVEFLTQTLRETGFIVDEPVFNETLLEKEDFRSFITEVPDYVRKAFPELWLTSKDGESILDDEKRNELLNRAYDEVFSEGDLRVHWTTIRARAANKPIEAFISVVERIGYFDAYKSGDLAFYRFVSESDVYKISVNPDNHLITFYENDLTVGSIFPDGTGHEGSYVFNADERFKAMHQRATELISKKSGARLAERDKESASGKPDTAERVIENLWQVLSVTASVGHYVYQAVRVNPALFWILDFAGLGAGLVVARKVSRRVNESTALIKVTDPNPDPTRALRTPKGKVSILFGIGGSTIRTAALTDRGLYRLQNAKAGNVNSNGSRHLTDNEKNSFELFTEALGTEIERVIVLLQENGLDPRSADIWIGSPGIFDKKGYFQKIYNIPGLQGHNLIDWVREYIKRQYHFTPTVHLYNDMQVTGRAEGHTLTAKDRHRPVYFLNLGTGLNIAKIKTGGEAVSMEFGTTNLGEGRTLELSYQELLDENKYQAVVDLIAGHLPEKIPSEENPLIVVGGGAAPVLYDLLVRALKKRDFYDVRISEIEDTRDILGLSALASASYGENAAAGAPARPAGGRLSNSDPQDFLLMAEDAVQDFIRHRKSYTLKDIQDFFESLHDFYLGRVLDFSEENIHSFLTALPENEKDDLTRLLKIAGKAKDLEAHDLEGQDRFEAYNRARAYFRAALSAGSPDEQTVYDYVLSLIHADLLDDGHVLEAEELLKPIELSGSKDAVVAKGYLKSAQGKQLYHSFRSYLRIGEYDHAVQGLKKLERSQRESRALFLRALYKMDSSPRKLVSFSPQTVYSWLSSLEIQASRALLVAHETLSLYRSDQDFLSAGLEHAVQAFSYSAKAMEYSNPTPHTVRIYKEALFQMTRQLRILNKRPFQAGFIKNLRRSHEMFQSFVVGNGHDVPEESAQLYQNMTSRDLPLLRQRIEFYEATYRKIDALMKTHALKEYSTPDQFYSGIQEDLSQIASEGNSLDVEAVLEDMKSENKLDPTDLLVLRLVLSGFRTVEDIREASRMYVNEPLAGEEIERRFSGPVFSRWNLSLEPVSTKLERTLASYGLEEPVSRPQAQVLEFTPANLKKFMKVPQRFAEAKALYERLVPWLDDARAAVLGNEISLIDDSIQTLAQEGEYLQSHPIAPDKADHWIKLNQAYAEFGKTLDNLERQLENDEARVRASLRGGKVIVEKYIEDMTAMNKPFGFGFIAFVAEEERSLITDLEGLLNDESEDYFSRTRYDELLERADKMCADVKQFFEDNRAEFDKFAGWARGTEAVLARLEKLPINGSFHAYWNDEYRKHRAHFLDLVLRKDFRDKGSEVPDPLDGFLQKISRAAGLYERAVAISNRLYALENENHTLYAFNEASVVRKQFIDALLAKQAWLQEDYSGSLVLDEVALHEALGRLVEEFETDLRMADEYVLVLRKEKQEFIVRQINEIVPVITAIRSWVFETLLSREFFVDDRGKASKKMLEEDFEKLERMLKALLKKAATGSGDGVSNLRPQILQLFEQFDQHFAAVLEGGLRYHEEKLKKLAQKNLPRSYQRIGAKLKLKTRINRYGYPEDVKAEIVDTGFLKKIFRADREVKFPLSTRKFNKHEEVRAVLEDIRAQYDRKGFKEADPMPFIDASTTLANTLIYYASLYDTGKDLAPVDLYSILKTSHHWIFLDYQNSEDKDKAHEIGYGANRSGRYDEKNSWDQLVKMAAFVEAPAGDNGEIAKNLQRAERAYADLFGKEATGARLSGLGRRTFLSAVIPALAALFLTAPGSQKQFTPQEKKKANLMARVLYDIAEWQKKSDKRGLPKETAAFLEKLHIETKLSNDADLVEIKVSYGRSFSFLSGYFNGKDVSGSKDDLKFKYPSAGYDYGIYTKSWPVSSKNNLTLVIVTPDGAFTLKGSYKQGDKSGTLVSFAVGKIGGRLAESSMSLRAEGEARLPDGQAISLGPNGQGDRHAHLLRARDDRDGEINSAARLAEDTKPSFSHAFSAEGRLPAFVLAGIRRNSGGRRESPDTPDDPRQEHSRMTVFEGELGERLRPVGARLMVRDQARNRVLAATAILFGLARIADAHAIQLANGPGTKISILLDSGELAVLGLSLSADKKILTVSQEGRENFSFNVLEVSHDEQGRVRAVISVQELRTMLRLREREFLAALAQVKGVDDSKAVSVGVGLSIFGDGAQFDLFVLTVLRVLKEMPQAKNVSFYLEGAPEEIASAELRLKQLSSKYPRLNIKGVFGFKPAEDSQVVHLASSSGENHPIEGHRYLFMERMDKESFVSYFEAILLGITEGRLEISPSTALDAAFIALYSKVAGLKVVVAGELRSVILGGRDFIAKYALKPLMKVSWEAIQNYLRNTIQSAIAA